MCCCTCDAEGEEDAKGSPVEQDDSLLDNWIKELESGIKGMADVAGVATEVRSRVSGWVGTDEGTF